MKLNLLLLAVLAFGCGPSTAGGANDCTDPATCPDNTSCPPGVLRCGPNKGVEKCNDSGTAWMPLGHCADNQSCSGGQCSPSSCSGMTTVCTADGRIQTCLPTNGTYTDPVSCPAGQNCVGTGCIMTVCTPNARFCDGMTVRQCDSLGSNSMQVDQCTGNQMCANGGCLDACLAADELKSFNGCHFYAVQTDNDSGNDGKENDIVVANNSMLTATVKVEVKNGATWGTVCNAVPVPPGMTHAFALRDPPNCDITMDNFMYLDRHIEGSGLVAGNAYRITSDAPIVAYYFNSDDKNGSASSSGAEVLLPKSTWGKKYYVIDWPAPGGSVDTRSSIDIVAQFDQTNVTVQLSMTSSVVMGTGVPMMNRGETRTFMLNEGDVLQLATLLAGDDLTGTLITSDKEVGVWAASECMTPTGTASCDHIEEQLLPVQAWGENYVAPRVAGRQAGCTNVDDCSPSKWRILAQVDGTVVALSAPTGVTLTPAGPLNLNSGQFAEVVATAPATQTSSFFIASNPNHPIFVMQLTGSEPAMVTSVPVEQYLQQYLFGVPDFFCTELVVTRHMGSAVLLDNMAISDSLFTPVGGGYEVAHLAVPQTQCGVGSSMGQVQAHSIKTMPAPDGHTYPAEVDLYGVDINCSYGYVGGLNITVINPIP
jgi:hypothetical protein